MYQNSPNSKIQILRTRYWWRWRKYNRIQKQRREECL